MQTLITSQVMLNSPPIMIFNWREDGGVANVPWSPAWVVQRDEEVVGKLV